MKVYELVYKLNKFNQSDTIIILKDQYHNAYIMVEEGNKLAITVSNEGWEGEMDGEDGQIIELV